MLMAGVFNAQHRGESHTSKAHGSNKRKRMKQKQRQTASRKSEANKHTHTRFTCDLPVGQAVHDVVAFRFEYLPTHPSTQRWKANRWKMMEGSKLGRHIRWKEHEPLICTNRKANRNKRSLCR